MAFKCQPGHWLSADETAEMLAFEENGLRRPAEYKDVVFDNTSGTRGGYRCKTDAEVQRVNDIANAEKEAASAAEGRRRRVLEGAGIDPATGVASRPQAFNTDIDLNVQQEQGAVVTAGGVAPTDPALFDKAVTEANKATAKGKGD